MIKKMACLSVTVLLVAAMASGASGATASGGMPTAGDYLAMSGKSRVSTVKALIEGAKEGGVKIRQTPISYCRKIDELLVRRPDMKGQSLAVVLKTIIVMDYDWDQKGVDKDQLARQFLGEEGYKKNKARLK